MLILLQILLEDNKTETVPESIVKQKCAFIGSTIAYIESKNKKPTEDEPSTSTQTLSFVGSAYTAALEYKQYKNDSTSMYTVIGADFNGAIVRQLLMDQEIDVLNIEIDKKLQTASLLTIELQEKQKQTKQNANVTQYNYEILNKIAFKYLYPRFKALNGTDSIYADFGINENAIKALMTNYGHKLFLQVSDVDYLKKYVDTLKSYYSDLKLMKKKEHPSLTRFLYLSALEAVNVPQYFCTNKDMYPVNPCVDAEYVDAQKILFQNYNKKKHVSYYDYLKQAKQLPQLLKLMSSLTKSQNIFIRISDQMILSSFASGEYAVLVDFQNKISDEAFNARFMHATVDNKKVQEALEIATGQETRVRLIYEDKKNEK
ncbi:Conserved_hypothetical protein [Hexamita inflata]|uniref:Uncharacterized protein n=1 Tax=Hexamita inflata TaxID=28002 RepID=A0AA86NZ72_9EUKA|nr:Conserved hypothetical protein [Hexamita inflata]